MENKEKYYTLLKNNNGLLNETELGEQIGLNEDETQQLLAQLLSEHKIEYSINKASNYTVLRKGKNNK